MTDMIKDPKYDRDRRQLLKMTGAGFAAAGAASVLGLSSAMAQDMSHGAANFYTSDKVTMQKVTFNTQYKTTVAGSLFTPKDLDQNAKNQAIIVDHPMGAVKEQPRNGLARIWVAAHPGRGRPKKLSEQGLVPKSTTKVRLKGDPRPSPTEKADDQP
jgi:hypothetical protein